jgi:hypothetical protein
MDILIKIIIRDFRLASVSFMLSLYYSIKFFFLFDYGAYLIYPIMIFFYFDLLFFLYLATLFSKYLNQLNHRKGMIPIA